MREDFGKPLEMPDAIVRYNACFLAREDADRHYVNLLNVVSWEQHRIRLFGREVPCPRLSSWYGDEACAYAYSGLALQPKPWLPELTELRGLLREVLGVSFNSVLLNRYRTGSDSMGWHADDERELGDRPIIASISLGAERTLKFRHSTRPELRQSIALGHGSLLVMAGGTQRNWKHALPKTRRAVGERINLTFRIVRVGQDSTFS